MQGENVRNFICIMLICT